MFTPCSYRIEPLYQQKGVIMQLQGAIRHVQSFPDGVPSLARVTDRVGLAMQSTDKGIPRQLAAKTDVHSLGLQPFGSQTDEPRSFDDRRTYAAEEEAASSRVARMHRKSTNFCLR